MEQHPANFTKWLFLPPVVAIPTILVVRSLGSPLEAEPVDPSLWGLIGLLFVTLTALYSLLILQGAKRGYIPVQLIAQGLLLYPLSASFGARIQWVGVTMIVCGAVVLTTFYSPSPSADSVEKTEEGVQNSELPVPFAITNKTGNILTISDSLLEIVGLSQEAALSLNIAMLFSPGAGTVMLGEKAWNVLQQPMKNDRICFRLEPKDLSDTEQVSQSVQVASFVDLVTGLHTRSYAMQRLEEELYRVRRYGRFLTSVLMRISFPPSSDSDPWVEDAFRAWCRAVHTSLRTSDIAFSTGPRDVFLILIDTDNDAAKLVIAKLEMLMRTLCPDHPSLATAVILRVTNFVKGGPGIPNAEDLVKQVDESLRAKYTLGS